MDQGRKLVGPIDKIWSDGQSGRWMDYIRGMIKRFSAQYTSNQEADTKSQSVDNLISLKVFDRENNISKLLNAVGNRCKAVKSVSN